MQNHQRDPPCFNVSAASSSLWRFERWIFIPTSRHGKQLLSYRSPVHHPQPHVNTPPHSHTHTHTHQAAVVVCVCVEEVVSSFWYGGLNQPGAQQWSYWGGRCPAWPGVDGGLWRGLGVDGCFLGGLLCVETLSPAAVAWHASASGRTDSSRQCQVSCCGRWRGPLSSWGIWRG